MVDTDNIEQYYQLGKTIGQGSFGVVKRAMKRDNGQNFAVKIINKENLEQDDLISVQQEVDILTKLDHPNVVKLYEIFEDDNNFYMIFELMTGGELFERVVELDHFGEKQASEAIKSIVDALQYCHEMGVAHRDLKPENLLYSTKDQGSILKISDFGFARFINNELMTTQCGTPGYVAPEILQGKGYDKSIDYWSLGVILYIMLSGQPPFYSESIQELLQQIQEGRFSFPAEQWEHISQDAKNLISGLLTVDPKKRFDYQQVCKHPWIIGKNLSNKPIKDIQSKIKEFNAKKQFKKLGAFFQAVNLLNHLKK